MYSRLAVRDVALHLVDVDLTNGLTVLVTVHVWPVHVNVHDMLRNHPIALLVMLVLDNEDHVESR